MQDITAPHWGTLLAASSSHNCWKCRWWWCCDNNWHIKFKKYRWWWCVTIWKVCSFVNSVHLNHKLVVKVYAGVCFWFQFSWRARIYIEQRMGHHRLISRIIRLVWCLIRSCIHCILRHDGDIWRTNRWQLQSQKCHIISLYSLEYLYTSHWFSKLFLWPFHFPVYAWWILVSLQSMCIFIGCRLLLAQVKDLS